MEREVSRVGAAVLPPGRVRKAVPTPINPDRVPVLPVYTVLLTAHGTTVDGELVETLPAHDDRMAALAELRRRAALRGRPVRATGKDPDGRVEHFIISPDGEVLPLPHGHPAPPPPARPPQPGPVRRPQPSAPQPQQPEPAAAWREQSEARATHYEQQARAEHGHDSAEAQRWARIRHQLRTEAEPWAASTDLWTAALAEGLAHLPANSRELRTAARTAYECWRKITDPAEAADTGPRFLAVLKNLDYPELLAAVEHWTAEAAALVASWAPPSPDHSIAPQEKERGNDRPHT